MLSPTEYTFEGPPSLMIATPCFGSWVAMVPASTKLAVDCGALAGSWVAGSMTATPNRWAEVTAWTSTPACRPRGAALVSTGCGDFTGPPESTEMAIRASSTAMSAASASDTSRGPLPCRRDSHSFERVSSMYGSRMVTVIGNHTGYLLERSSICFYLLK